MLPRLQVVTTATMLLLETLKIGFFATFRERAQENYTYLSKSLVWCWIFNIRLSPVGVGYSHPCSQRRAGPGAARGGGTSHPASATQWPPWSSAMLPRRWTRAVQRGYRNALHALGAKCLVLAPYRPMLVTEQGSAGWDRDVPKLDFDKWKDLLWISEVYCIYFFPLQDHSIQWGALFYLRHCWVMSSL